MNVTRPGAGKCFFRDAALRPAINQAKARRRTGDRDVVGDRQVGNQRQFLKNAGNSRLRRRRRIAECDRLALYSQCTRIWLDHPSHHLYQR